MKAARSIGNDFTCTSLVDFIQTQMGYPINKRSVRGVVDRKADAGEIVRIRQGNASMPSVYRWVEDELNLGKEP
jgi:DNA-binding transcriptional regulator PaaX